MSRENSNGKLSSNSSESSLVKLEKEITIAKNDMISAFQERMDHFENKLSTKDKEIGVLKETISAFSKHSRNQTPPLEKSSTNLIRDCDSSKDLVYRIKQMNVKLDSMSNSLEDLREEKSADRDHFEFVLTKNISGIKAHDCFELAEETNHVTRSENYTMAYENLPEIISGLMTNLSAEIQTVNPDYPLGKILDDIKAQRTTHTNTVGASTQTSKRKNSVKNFWNKLIH